MALGAVGRQLLAEPLAQPKQSDDNPWRGDQAIPLENISDFTNIILGSTSLTRGIIYSIMIVVGIMMDTFILVAVFNDRRLYTRTNLMVCHLSSLGLLFSVFFMPVFAESLLKSRWTIACTIHGFATSTVSLAMQINLVALGWDKYKTIAFPLCYDAQIKRKYIPLWLAAVWLPACIISTIPLIQDIRAYGFNPTHVLCTVTFTKRGYEWYGILFACFAFYIPLVLLYYFYLYVFRTTRSQHRRVAQNIVSMVVHTHVVLSKGIRPSQRQLRGKKASCAVIYILGAFTVLCTPYSILIMLESLQGRPQNDIFGAVATTLYHSSPIINALVYGVRAKTLRDSFIEYSRRKIKEYTCSVPATQVYPYNRRLEHPICLALNAQRDSNQGYAFGRSTPYVGRPGGLLELAHNGMF